MATQADWDKKDVMCKCWAFDIWGMSTFRPFHQSILNSLEQ